MKINQTTLEELQPIKDILESLGIRLKHQQLITDVIESHQEAWEQMKIEQRSSALSSTLQILKLPADLSTNLSAKAHFESFFLIT